MNDKLICKKDFSLGFRQGIPIGLGYLSVSFSFGIQAVNNGLSVFQSGLVSLTNLTSAGQFAGISVIATGGSLITMALTQLIINLRYALMSTALSQKLSSSFSREKKLFIAFFNTDEIFAVAISRESEITFPYMLGLIILPLLGWVGGTIFGAAAAKVIPDFLMSALGIALYGMFIAIITPVARKSKAVTLVILVAIIISCLFYYLPMIRNINTGLVIVISTVFSSALGAALFPMKLKKEEDKE